MELCVNNTVVDSTEVSPAAFTYGQSLHMPVDHLDGLHPNQAAQTSVEMWHHLSGLVQHRLVAAQKLQKKYSDAKHTDVLLAVGDKVLLSTRNLNLTGSRKFKDKFVGPFVVQQRIGEVAYKLDLSSRAALRNVHPVFHVSLPRQWRTNGLYCTALPVDIDDKVEYEVH